MVQVLPYVQSPLEQLTPYLAQAAGDIGQGLGMRSRNKADQSILSQLRSGNIAAADYNTLYSKLSPEAKKQEEPFLQSRLRVQEAEQKEQFKTEAALKKESAQRKVRAEGLLSSAKKAKSLLKYTGSTKLPWSPSFNATKGGINRSGLAKRNQFDVIAADFAGFFRDLDTKGQLPQGLYDKVIAPRLPNSELSERENEGRIDGIIDLAKQYGGIEDKQENEQKINSQERPPLESFYR